MSQPLAQPVDEARRLSALADAAGVRARLLGGVAVALSAGPGALPEVLRRPYKDLDYVVPRGQSTAWAALLEAEGYAAVREFNALHGAHRLLHLDLANGRQLDTFVSTFSMCHSIDLEQRLPAAGATLAPEDLLLTKLQIVEVNDKDLTDTIALLLTHPVSDDPDGISPARLAAVVGRDWGWYTTLGDNLEKVGARLSGAGLDLGQVSTVRERLGLLTEVLAAAPKTMKWKVRAKVGRRVPWYELPEEVD